MRKLNYCRDKGWATWEEHQGGRNTLIVKPPVKARKRIEAAAAKLGVSAEGFLKAAVLWLTANPQIISKAG